MAEEKVSLLVQYIVQGQEQMKQVDADLNKLAAKSEVSTKAVLKGNDAQTKSNMTLGKQIPILRDLQPLMGGLGLGWLAGAGAIAALGMGAMQANQAFETWFAGTLALAAATNTLTGGTQSQVDATGEAIRNAAKLDITEGDYAEAMVIAEAATRNHSTALSLVSDAAKISHDTGIPLIDVINQLTGAFSGAIPVYDEFGKQVTPGVTALQTMETQLGYTASGIGSFKNSVDTDWNRAMETLGTGSGGLLNILGDIGKWLLINATPLGEFIDAINDIKQALASVDWDALWERIGAWWSDKWPAFKGWVIEEWNNLISHFDIDWDSVWANLGSTWSRIWRGAVNIGIINPINSMIRLLNLIHVDLPDWMGGGTIGFNISEIPQLAKGGKALTSGTALVGEEGPELLNLPQGASVTPLNNGGGFGTPITIPIYIGNELLTQYVINDFDQVIRLRGGY